MQKWQLLAPRMRCSVCGKTSTQLYEAYVEHGVGRCPHCRTLDVPSRRERPLAVRISRN